MGEDIQYNQLDMFNTSDDLFDLQKKVKELEKECERLQVENSGLKRQLCLKATQSHSATQVPSDLATKKKIKLFRSIFKGRTDVFPKRWESRNGKSGYSPFCDNEWKPSLCEKPKTKCSQCNNRALTQLNDQVLYDHLSGKQTIGVYPLLLDDSCGFLAVDFDKSSWQDDVLAFLQTCDELNIPASLERSRSGNGGHVWIFFSEFIPAVLARKMGNVILAKTMDKRIEIGLDSYDRLFPNQDTMPNGGFGNLIALPLQKQPRQQDNSVFIDRNMQAYSDQWEYLATIKRMSKIEVEKIAALKAEEVDQPADDLSIEASNAPWQSTPIKTQIPYALLPKELRLVIANGVYIEKEKLPSLLINRLIHLAAFRNPEFYRAQAMRMPVYNKPRMIACYDDLPKHIVLPRGCLADVILLLEDYKINTKVVNESTKGKPLRAGFKGKLRTKQKDAVKALR